MREYRGRERIGLAATVLVVGGVLLLALGFWRNWFSFSASTADTPGTDRIDLQFSVNPNEMQRDARKAVDEADNLQEQLSAVSEIRTIDGIVTRVDPAARALVVKSEDEPEITVRVTEEAEVTRKGEPATFSGVQTGDHVTVVYKLKDDARLADKVSVQ